ncbi:MAG: UDP-N-acetylmuramoyl-tripeptide--D-alanyl-D-alanine ligase, partial [bacterium]|nr:UDP-N-acetylmuramoyl-tripeptide--D-alanyl-D-alanine ligase [bacterium]
MLFFLQDLFHEQAIFGDIHAGFNEVSVSGEDGGDNTLFINLDDTYFADASRMETAYYMGTRLFLGREFPQQLRRLPGITFVKSTDPLADLTRLASLYRAATMARIIGITGSDGKTTTKDMVAHLLRQKYPRTLKTYRNYNGGLGVLLTLRKLKSDDQYAVIEIGLGEKGSVARGAKLASPHLAVITNIGVSHIGYIGSKIDIALEKAKILDHLSAGGVAVLNGDDAFCRQLTPRGGRRHLFFGLEEGNDIRASEIKVVSMGEMQFAVSYEQQKELFRLNLIGNFQIYNALAAITVGLLEGLSLVDMAERMKTFVPGEQRFRVITIGDVTILDDGYNSNPRTISGSLQTLSDIITRRLKIAVLGDMQELGRFSATYYQQLGQSLSTFAIDHYIFLGQEIA